MLKIETINIRNIIEESMLRNAIIVDVRDREDFLKGHIPMAVGIPLENIEEGKFKLPKNKDIITYCYRGSRSMMATRILTRKSYRAINAVGGIKNYNGSLSKG